jgi:hypothetical protein
MRVERTYLGVKTLTSIFFVNYFTNYSGKAEPQCQATPVEFGSPHEAIYAGFVDTCLPILHSY